MKTQKMPLLSVLLASLFACSLSSAAVQDKSDNDLVTIELKDGEKVMVYVKRETRDDVYVMYPDADLEVAMPRFKIENIRKPTEKEMEELKKKK